MTRYVYILSRYHEYGAQDVRATITRGRLENMLREMCVESEPNYAPDATIAGLQRLLAQNDADLLDRDGHDLTEGWGGFMLHVVELEQ